MYLFIISSKLTPRISNTMQKWSPYGPLWIKELKSWITWQSSRVNVFRLVFIRFSNKPHYNTLSMMRSNLDDSNYSPLSARTLLHLMLLPYNVGKISLFWWQQKYHAWCPLQAIQLRNDPSLALRVQYIEIAVLLWMKINVTRYEQGDIRLFCNHLSPHLHCLGQELR